MKTFNTYKLWGITGVFAFPMPDETICPKEVSSSGLSLDALYRDLGNTGLALYGDLQWESEPDYEPEDWPEGDLKTLLYEMSTEVEPVVLVA